MQSSQNTCLYLFVAALHSHLLCYYNNSLYSSQSFRKEEYIMKVCSICNTTVNDEASFCPNCGKMLPAGSSQYLPRSSTQPISVGGWIGRTLIPCIPLVGGIVYLVMLFIWSGDTKKEETFRNWAKAQLIVMAIVLVLAIIGAILGVTVFSDVLNYL